MTTTANPLQPSLMELLKRSAAAVHYVWRKESLWQR